MDRLPPAPSEDRHRDDAEDCMPPTPKTLARLQDDPLLRFLKRG